jgi:hypothetical protein
MADTRGPGYGSSNTGMPMWGWVAAVIAVIVVLGLIFAWSGDSTQQQAGTPTSQNTTTTPPPAKVPAPTPPANTTPPAKQ